MPVILMAVKLAAYISVVGLTLKYANRLFVRANNRIVSCAASASIRSLLASLAAIIPLALTGGATVLFAAVVDGNPLPILGLTYNSTSIPFVTYGAGLGFGCVMLMFFLGMLGGFIRVRPAANPEQHDAHIPLFFGGLSDYFSGAILEEVVTRGYVYYLLCGVFGAVPAIIVSSLLFSLVHLIRPNRIPLIFTLNAFIFGLLTGACRYHTGLLWLPMGLHISWNVTAGPLLGLPYSGISYDQGVVKSEVSGPEWFTGGFYSPDAGVLGTFALLVAAVGLRLIAPII